MDLFVLVLGAPDLNAVLQVGLTTAEQRGHKKDVDLLEPAVKMMNTSPMKKG